MFGILDRYVGRTVLSAILICTFSLVGLSSIIKFIDQLGNVGDGDFTALHALYRVILLMPGEIVLFFPMAALLGGVIGLGQMASSSELVILQAAGLSRSSIVLSALKTVVPAMLLVMLLGEYVVPYGEQKSKDIKTAAISGGKIAASSSGIWIKESGDFISIGSAFRDGSLHDINMFRFDKNGVLTQIVHAETAKAAPKGWLFAETSISDLSNKQILNTTKQPSFLWKTNLTPDKISVVSVSPDELSAQGLYRYIQYMKSNGQTVSDYELELWRKAFAPLTVIAMLLLAASTIFGPLRSVSMGARLISGVLIGFAFYVFNQIFGPMSLVYHFPPLIAAIIPSLLFMGAALYLLNRKKA